MSEQWTTFQRWAKANLPRGYKMPAEIKVLIENRDKVITPEFIEQLRSNRSDLVYLHAFQTSLLGQFLLLKGDMATFQSIALIRSIQFARALDLKSLDKHPGKVLANPNKYFHPERLRWGWKLSDTKGRPGRDRIKFLLLLTPYRKLIEEETIKRIDIEKMALPKMTPEERGRKEKKIRRECLAIARNTVHRAWSDFTKELPEAIIAFLLAVQFHVWKDWQP